MELILDFSATSETDALVDLAACYQAYVGHELLNQLVSIQAYARLVLEEEADRLGAEGRDHLARLADLAQRTDGLARRLADIGRLLREPALGPGVEVEGLMREAVAEAKTRARRDDVRFEVQIAPCRVGVSSTLLSRVLLELLDNATRAIPEGRGGVISLVSRVVGRDCLIRVEDDGRGLDAAARLFEPFRGAGLGLFLVRQAVARWRGRLEVQSESGTSIVLTVPAVEVG